MAFFSNKVTARRIPSTFAQVGTSVKPMYLCSGIHPTSIEACIVPPPLPFHSTQPNRGGKKGPTDDDDLDYGRCRRALLSLELDQWHQAWAATARRKGDGRKQRDERWQRGGGEGRHSRRWRREEAKRKPIERGGGDKRGGNGDRSAVERIRGERGRWGRKK